MTTFQISANILIIHKCCFEHNAVGDEKNFHINYLFSGSPVKLSTEVLQNLNEFPFMRVPRTSQATKYIHSKVIERYSKQEYNLGCIFDGKLRVSCDKFVLNNILTRLTVDLTRIQVDLGLIVVFFEGTLGISGRYRTGVLG